MHIRPETPGDGAAIHELTVAAFGGESEARLVALIRASVNFVPEFSLVAVEDGVVIGHVLLSRVALVGETRRTVLSLAPLTVHPDHQGRGLGSALLHAAVDAALAAGEDIVVLEGHPGYYPRFGFEPAVPAGIDKPDPRVPDDAFMVLFLDQAARGTTGRVEYPPAFHEAGAIGP